MRALAARGAMKSGGRQLRLTKLKKSFKNNILLKSRKLSVKKIALAAAITCASFIGGTADAQQKCWAKPGGSYLQSCKDIQVTGPTCDSRSSTSWIYGYEVKAVCKDNRGQYVQRAPYPISTNEGNGGGTPKIQKQTCRELGNSNGFLTCTKS